VALKISANLPVNRAPHACGTGALAARSTIFHLATQQEMH
jgi:hypothetical protein